MESNKYLWQPRRNGPIHIRVSYADPEGNKKTFVRSLRTSHWPTSRKIRDAEFMPLILNVNTAKTQLELITAMYPQLIAQMQKGLHGGWGPDAAATGRTLGDLVEKWLKAITAAGGNYAMAAGSTQRYRSVARGFLAHLGPDTAVDEITPDTMSAYRDERLQTYRKNKKTVDLELTALRNMFRFAVEKMGLNENPAQGVNVRRTAAERNRERRAGRRRVPTLAEADRICTAFPASGRCSAEDCQDFAMVARYTGMRQGEIAQLRADDVVLLPAKEFLDAVLQTPQQFMRPFGPDADVPEGQVLCLFVRDRGETQSTKTGEERIVPVANRLLETVTKRLRDCRGGPLFPTAAGDRVSSFARAWLIRVKKIHPELTMHGFRHYATSAMENAGVNRAASAAVLGHTDNSVHGGYVHVKVETLREAVNRIG